MTDRDTGLSAFLRDVENLLYEYEGNSSDDWMTRSNRESMAGLQTNLESAWLESRKGIRARFHQGAIQGHAGPANQLLKAVLALNETVVALVNKTLDKPYTTIDDNVRGRLGLWAIPATKGSFIMELICPPTGDVEPRANAKPIDGQTTVPELDDMVIPGADAVDQVMGVLHELLDSSKGKVLQLEEKLIDLGAHATTQLGKFADRCSELGVSVDVDDRTQQNKPLVIRPQDARLLKGTIRTLGLEEEPLVIEGEWLTSSKIRGVFDIRDKDGIVRNGTVPKTLMTDSVAALEKYVQAQIRVIHKGGPDGQARMVLEKVTVLADSVPADFYTAVKKEHGTDA